MGASESKLGFKQGIFRLAEEDNIPPTDPLWAKFYQLPETADDVLALWSPNDLHALTLTRPDDRPLPNTQVHPRKNLETLVYTCISRLHHLQALSANAEQQRSSSLEALNCIRMLTRAFPYIYEAEHISQWEHRFFWKPQTPQQVWDKRNNRPGSWVDGLNPQADLDLTSDGPSEEHASEKVLDPPLGEQLIDILVRYLFWPGFTLPKKQSTDGSSEQRADFRIWNSGIGCRYSAGMTKENEKNAVEVLRLLLSLCSRQMYIPPHAVSAADVRPLVYITTKTDRQIVLTLICSLLNTILKYNPASWIVPLEWSSDGDPRTRLVHTSLQFLLVLLLYSEPSGETNQFRKAMGRLHRAEDFQFIQQGITMVLTQPVSGINIPGMQRECPWAGEALSLFWELLQVNKRFQLFIIETDRVHDFVVMVLYYAMAYKDEPAKQGLIRMCALILQTLSVDSSFGKRLNKVFVGQDSLPASVKINHFHGSYADFLVTTIHTLMTTTKGRLDSIYPTFLAIIYNVSPYVKDLQRATSSKILDLFIQLSNPKFLLEKETNYTLLVTLLQAISTTLAWQSECRSLATLP
ncbi:hypothetical protein K470DRAFT_254202 [Piedraia hortae CBS 480.64]|uniref:Uncharacterized protein n=1 Tax=Piedraia hortae CBS 480.64 TaxID=1314780 RepID=A0A6A7CC39_9PEZI|nr:hypothetical protein K470DRAFT_254202 [Piedraia hortae CBS 480.64]